MSMGEHLMRCARGADILPDQATVLATKGVCCLLG